MKTTKMLMWICSIFFVMAIMSFTFDSTKRPNTVDVREVSVSGHKYVVASSTSGVSIVHSHSCYCVK